MMDILGEGIKEAQDIIDAVRAEGDDDTAADSIKSALKVYGDRIFGLVAWALVKAIRSSETKRTRTTETTTRIRMIF